MFLFTVSHGSIRHGIRFGILDSRWFKYRVLNQKRHPDGVNRGVGASAAIWRSLDSAHFVWTAPLLHFILILRSKSLSRKEPQPWHPSYISVGELPWQLFLDVKFQHGGSGETLTIIIMRHNSSKCRGDNAQRLHDCWCTLRTIILFSSSCTKGMRLRSPECLVHFASLLIFPLDSAHVGPRPYYSL